VIRFSSRTPASLAPNQLSVAVERLRAGGARLIDLTLSNPTRAGLEYPEAEILAALADSRTVRYEPSPRGLPAAREAVAAWHAEQGGEASADRLILTGSTSEAYGWLFKLLCEAGDAVMTPRPSYPLFECLAVLEGVRAVQYPLLEELRWGTDLAELERWLDPRARALVVVNPNNPTGTYLKRSEWQGLQDFAARKGLALIVDEVFFDYAWEDDAERVSSLQGRHEALTFTLSGLSKIAALPQMKLGWIHVSGPPALRGEALERLEWIADSYLPVSAPVQYAAGRWLELTPGIQDGILRRLAENRLAVRELLGDDSAWRALPAEGGWTMLLDAPRICPEEDWALACLEPHHVLVQPGYFYDFEREALLAISLLTEPRQFREALTRMSPIFRPV
jgi:aspartate/methionine/tyrosine aminotransferase